MRTAVPDSLTPLLHPVGELLEYPGNPRRGNTKAVQASLRAHGQYRPIVANKRTRHVLAGNHTLRAARALGWTQIAVVWLDVDDEHAARILLVDNKTGDDSTYDDQALVDLLTSLPGLDGTGWSDTELAELLAGLDPEPEQHTDVDDAPDLPIKPISQPGQVWELGPHRLAIGDSTDPAVLDAATGGRPIDLLLTDPPYGVAYVGAGGMTIRNDDLDPAALRTLLEQALTAAADRMRPGAPFYLFSPSGALETTFRLALPDQLGLRQQLVWVKDSLVLGRADYHGQHETILYGWRPTAGEPTEPPYEVAHDTVLYGWRSGAGHTWEGGRKQTTVWDFPKPRRSDVHPTMKPVAMLEEAIGNSSRPGALVLDGFAGSGSTLIACHATRRRAALVELDPVYADVICRRWEEHTGVRPRLSGGRARSFT